MMLTRSLILALVATSGLALLSACDDGVVEQRGGYSDGAFWQGSICMRTTRAGKQVRVNPSNCPRRASSTAPVEVPPLPESEAVWESESN